jgi:hypothetical protein
MIQAASAFRVKRGLLSREDAAFRRPLDAGFDLGNHIHSHVSIDQVPFEAYKADPTNNEIVTRCVATIGGLHAIGLRTAFPRARNHP